MSTKNFKDWQINESISPELSKEISDDLYTIPIIKKWEEDRAKKLNFGSNRYTINILNGARAHGYPNSLRMYFNLPRVFINKVRELEKYAHCHIAPDVVSDKLQIVLIDDSKLNRYSRDSDVVRTFKDTGDMELEVRFNTNTKSEVRKIFEDSINFIIEDLRDSNYIFNSDIRRFPKLNSLMKQQVDETYQKMLDDLIDGNLDDLKDHYVFDDDTVMAMIARALDEDPELEDQINDLPMEAKSIWFSSIGGGEARITKDLSKMLKSLKKVKDAIRLI